MGMARHEEKESDIDELRPRKRLRREEPERVGVQPTTTRNNIRQAAAAAAPTQTSTQAAVVQQQVGDAAAPTPLPVVQQYYPRDDATSDGLVFDTVKAPSVSFAFTGTTPPVQPQISSVGAGSPTSAAVVTTTTSASSSPQNQSSGGLSGTTQAIVIAASIAGTIIIVGTIVLISVCYRRKKQRKAITEHPLTHIAQQQKSNVSLHSEWPMESPEFEKQSLMRTQQSSRSTSPAGTTAAASNHSQQRSVGANGYKPFLAQIPESPLITLADGTTSPTSIYTRAPSPSNARTPGRGTPSRPASPLRPPPLRLTERRGSEPAVGTAMLPSPNDPYSAVRMPHFSGAPSSIDRRRSSLGQSTIAGSNYGYGEEEEAAVAAAAAAAAAPDMGVKRHTSGSETGSKPNGYRDSLWSVAASSFWGANNSNKFKSGYSEWTARASSAALSHTQSVSTRGGHSSVQSTTDTITDAGTTTFAAPSRARSHSSLYSAHRPSAAVIPAMPPMPSAQQLQQQYGQKATHLRVASEASNTSGRPQFKSRLHSVDFWAREEREMRLGSFAVAELEGSPSTALISPRTIDAISPVDYDGRAVEVDATAMPVAGLGIGPVTVSTTPRPGDMADSYFAGAPLPVSSSASSQNASNIPQGYTPEVSAATTRNVTRDATRDVTRDVSRDVSRPESRPQSSGTATGDANQNGVRESSSTVATVFRHHPGDMVMF